MRSSQKNWVPIVAVALSACALLLCSRGFGQESESNLIRRARGFLEKVAVSDFDQALTFVDPAAQNLTRDEISATWRSLQLRNGAFRSLGPARVEKVGDYIVVFVGLQFEREPLESRIVFNADERIAGLFFSQPTAPASPETADTPPEAEAKPEDVLEQDYFVQNGEIRLPGTLALPEGNPPFIGVVLIPGSGPVDRDGTIGANKPMRDVAWGLAARGIASLRYDKRTAVYAAQMAGKEFTYREEFVDDAIAAVDRLREDARIHKRKVFLLGHGLGGQLVPKILSETDPFFGSNKLAGGIIMGGSARPLQETIIDHLNHIAMEDGDFSLQERTAVLNFQSGVEAMLESRDKNYPAVMGITYTYLKALNDYNCLKAVQGLDVPLLIAQGGRDFQVTVAHDYQAWQDALAEKKNATFKLYPKLNHLFIEGEGASYPSEYERPGEVSKTFLDEAAEWMRKQ